MKFSAEEKAQILKELGGIPEALYDELVQELLSQIQSQILEIDKAISSADLEEGRKLAHSIKGASGNLRILPLQEASKLLEDSFKEKKSIEIIKEKFNFLKIKTLDCLRA